MTTNVQLIEGSLRDIGVIAEGQTVSAEQGSVALTRLNQLMESYAAEDLNVGYFAQTSTTDTLPLPAWAERGIRSKLALDLLTIYPSGQSSPMLTDDELNGFGVIRRICMVAKLKPANMTHLGLGEARSLRTSILYDV